MNKLSEDLQELSDRVSRLEERVEGAQQESKDRLQASIERSKADAKARQDAFKMQVSAKQASAAKQWEELQANYNQKVGEIKSRIEADKDAHEAKRARRRADSLAADASDLIAFAVLAIGDAEVTLLEAIAAEAYAESLAEKTTV